VQAPVAKRIAHLVERHGTTITDEWAWLRDRDDPDTLAYLKAENEYADAWFEPLAPLRDAIFGEIKSRTQETDLTVPVRKGPWWYYRRTVEGLEYPVHCRRPAGAERNLPPADPVAEPPADEQVLIDENAEALARGDGSYFELGALEMSPGHSLLAWSYDTDGSEVFRLRFRDLATGAELADEIERTYPGVAWSNDDRYLFFTRTDAAMRPFQVWRHELGTSSADDVLILEEPDERFFLSVDLTRSQSWIVISADSNTTSEVRLIPADDPTAEPRLMSARRDDHEYAVDHWGDRFVILTNDDAEDFRVVTAPLDDPSESNWTELLPHRPGTRVNGVDAFAGHLVVHEWADATPRLRLLFPDGTQRVPEFDEEVHTVDLGANPEYGASTVRYQYQSLETPATVFEEDVATGERQALKRQPVPGVELDRYRSRREWATAPDGERVPIDVVWRDDTPLDGTAPLVVYAYGSYEASIPATFSVARLSLLDRGVVWALAHPRGGGELGRRWYREGKLLAKRNTFTDTIACAERLVSAGYAAAGRVALRGGSAGGLLVGACINLRPDLFASAVAQVPFVDVMNTMSDPTLPLTVIEWEEWGNPADPEFAEYMASYAPYENVSATEYPALYVTAGLNDPRVSYHEPAKWVAKLRAITAGVQRQPILLRTELGAGHAGPSGRYDAWRDEARTLSFLLETLGAGAAPLSGEGSDEGERDEHEVAHD